MTTPRRPRRSSAARVALVACVAAAAALPAFAQITAVSARGFVLDETLDYALAHHPTLRAAEQGVVTARSGYRSADAVGDFTADASASYSFRGPVTSIRFPNAQGQMQTMTIGRPLTGQLSLNFSKPLNLSAQRDAARAIVAAQVDLASSSLLQANLGIMLGVKQTFYNVLLAEHLRLIALDAVDRTEAHLRIAQAQFGQGVVAQYDVDRAEADVASARAQLAQAEGAVRTALVYLASAMGLNPADRVEIQADLLPEFIAVDEGAARAIAHGRPEVKQLETQAALYRAQAHQFGLQDRPVLAAFGSTGYSIGSGFTEGTNYSVGLQLSIPLENGGGHVAQERTALEQAKQSDLEVQGQILAIDTNIRTALEQLATARAGIEDAAQAVTKARDALTRVRLSYQNQLAAWIDLRDAEAGLTATEQQFVTTLFRYRLARADLESAIGVRDLGALAVPDPRGAPSLPEIAGIRRPESAPPIAEIPGVAGQTVTPADPPTEGDKP